MSAFDEGPRERLQRCGAEALSEAELVSLLLGTGRPNEPVTILAARLLHEEGGLYPLSKATLRSLTRLGGVGPTKAARLVAAFEIGRRARQRPLVHTRPISGSAQVAAAYRDRLAHLDQERFVAIALDARNRPLSEAWSARGTLRSCPVQPSDIYRVLLREAASGVLFVHNHPSGDPRPSFQDISLTNQLCKVSELLGISVLDHVIVGDPEYFSFLDEGLLLPPRDG